MLESICIFFAGVPFGYWLCTVVWLWRFERLEKGAGER